MNDGEKFPTAKVTPRGVKSENLSLGNPTLPQCQSDVSCRIFEVTLINVPIDFMDLDDETRIKRAKQGLRISRASGFQAEPEWHRGRVKFLLLETFDQESL